MLSMNPLTTFIFRLAVLSLIFLPGVAVAQEEPLTPLSALDFQGDADPKLTLGLKRLVNEYRQYRQKGGFKALKRRFKPTDRLVRVTTDEMVYVDVVAEDAASIMGLLKQRGMVKAVRSGRIISGKVPIAAAEALAALPDVQFIRPVLAMTNVGSTTSQGDPSMGTDLLRRDFGPDGSGLVVGVLSDSYNCYSVRGEDPDAADDVASGDLPDDVVIRKEYDECATSGIDEGRAMMQLIHDVAPGADLAFYTAFMGEADFANGILDLANNPGADVIVDDVSYFAEPMFQDGVIAQAVDTVKGNGVAYFSSAGNNARDSYEQIYRPTGIDLIPSLSRPGSYDDDAHDFDPGPGIDYLQQITIPDGKTLTLVLQWDQPFFSVSGAPGCHTNMEVFLINDPPTTLLAGGFSANIGGDAVEVMQYTDPPGGGDGTYNIHITKYGSGPDPGKIKYVLFRFNGTIDEYDTASSTVYGHSNAAGAHAIGAAYYVETPAFGTDPPLLSLSSSGPTPILFDTSGSLLSPAVVRQKPEIVAPDGTNTTFFGADVEPDGFENFFGTSAAAPHAAALAALMLDCAPSLPPDAIYQALEATAIDMGPAGVDDDSGFGLVDALAAALYAGCRPFADLNTDGVTDLADVILGLQVLANLTPSQAIGLWTDVNGDGRVSMAEIIYALQKIAGLR